MNKYQKNFYKNIKTISSYYDYLTQLTSEHYYIGTVNEWIVDNYYLIVEKEKSAKQFMKNRKCRYHAFRENVDLFQILYKIFEKHNFKLDESTLMKELNLYQDNFNYYFTYPEINSIDVVSYLVLLEELAHLCIREEAKLKQSLEVKNIMSTVEADLHRLHGIEISDYLNLDDDIVNKPVFLERLNAELKELGQVSNEVFKQLNEILDHKGVNLNKVIEFVYQEAATQNMLVANIFNSIVKMNKMEPEGLYRKVSKTEYVLWMDPYYGNMTKETKQLYRSTILKNSKKQKMTEYEYVKSLLSISLKENKHIGEFLLEKDHRKMKTFIFLSLVIVLTLVLSIFLSRFFIPIRVLGTLLLLIPVSEVVIQIVTRTFLKFCPPKPIPKLDYSEGIPKSSATVALIVTILKSVDKVEEMFDKLESYYLANKSDNLYFTLLGDCSSSSHQIEPFDDEVLEAGMKRVEKLNKKYGKEIFYFTYRKRVYNESEEEWLGFERKRGALEHFNRLLLGKMSEEEQNQYYMGHTFHNFHKQIKYVITLDQDTQLIMGSAFQLVGAMAHPLNQPILNADRTKVIRGYGILQPKVSVDVESTNQSLYTQIYAGIGGYDIYNKVVSNFYQDVFQEGSYWGKGIYDVEIFDQVLTGLFPNNRILSHDLLEGNYIRCGFLSDVEIIDDFPSTFLADASRRHRWARGDMQIASWIQKKKSPFNLIERWKMIDNLRRGLLDSSLLLILLVAFLFGVENPSLWIIFVTGVLILPILFYIRDKVKIQKERTLKIKHYENIAYGFKAVFIRTFSTFSALPYNAKLYLDAFIRAWYRVHISHKHLLAWITADDASKNTKNTFLSYLVNFKVNYVISLIFILLVYLFRREYLSLALGTSLIFIISSLVFYLISKDISRDNKTITKKEKEDLRKTAYDTWKFYDQFLTEENNYLIIDNYQLNRDVKEDIKTSPTNIGFSLMALISASELQFITREEACERIEKVIETVERLEKWHGHLYNWYNVKTLERMYPSAISTVDSGNFVASLILTKSFIKQYRTKNLKNRIENLIRQTNFKYLYNKSEGVFSCGYDAYSEQLIPFNYNKFASESRLTSFIAIAKGDVKKQHWFLLDKTLTTFQGKKGLLSWSGTSFEYYMPLIWMKTYPNTLLDESYYFAHYCQKEYMKRIDSSMPWGISEAAYNLLDDSQNYKYKAFGTPYLKFRDNVEDRIVLAPYGSILAISQFPKDVYNNMQKFKKLNMYGDYGFLESYDYEDRTPVFSYFAHHQGMILCSLTNYLTGNSLQNYFHKDIRVQAYDVLNKEKVQIEPMIDLKIVKYKKYDYNKEIFENDIREYTYLSQRPEVSVLSNSRYTILLNDRGAGFSRYKTIQLNRYRKITNQNYGNFLYIRDLENNKVWSNTYVPTNVKPERYSVVFSLDRIRYMRADNHIVTSSEIFVTKQYNAEIRKITFKNVSQKAKKLELTTYTEPILSENEADTGHRVFNSMFIKSQYHKETDSLILNRRLRGTNERYYMIQKLWIDHPLEEYSYETERSHFIGKESGYQDPTGLHTKLTNYVGENLDPICSIRNRIEIPPLKEVTVYMITGFGKSEEQVLAIAEAFQEESAIEDASELATIMVNADTKRIGVTGSDMHLYNTMLNYLYQTSRINLNENRKKLLMMNSLGQDTLWKFGISGDRPIVLVEMSDLASVSLAQELLKAFEYYKSKCIFVDLVIMNSPDEKVARTISKIVNDELYHMYAVNNFSRTPGRVVVIDYAKISTEELNLFRGISRLYFNTVYNNSLREQIAILQRENQINNYEEQEQLYSEETYEDEKLDYDNGYGGFTEDGREYYITNPNTPMPWSNVLTNGHFGTVVTNNDNGFTYADNSREYKITKWTNDTLIDDKSEGITINQKQVHWHDAIHGLGYSKFKFKDKEYKIDATYFVPKEDDVKIGIFTIKNLSNKDCTLDISYWINPVLGVSEEKTVRHLVCNYYELNNFLTIQNRYAMNFKNNMVYMSSTEKVSNVEIQDVKVKKIHIEKEIAKKESVTFAFLLGCEKSLGDLKEQAEKYQDLDYVFDQLEKTKLWWKEQLETIQVQTPDDSFNYMMNSWYLYQTLASRLMAKTGFYQVSGAFGFRDQLQDAMNVCIVHPDVTRKQILLCARHQFHEGDVLHWWHLENHFGLRSRYKDDYLWLVYATVEYLRISDDRSILEEPVPFVLGDTLNDDEEEKGMVFSYSEEELPLYEHLKLAVDKLTQELGENGLPLIGGGDWNDGMNCVGIKGKGTSVWLGFFAHEVVERFIEMTTSYMHEDTTKYEEFNKKLQDSLQQNAWDGEYFLRAYFDNGDKLGSHENDECKIDLISQSWAILSDVATEKQIKSIVQSVEDNLVDEEHRLIKLLTPAFSHPKNNPGYIRDYSCGIRENGGQYTHAVSWWIMALIKLGLYDYAYRYFQMMNPIHHTKTKSDVEHYQVEPYVIAADIYSNPDFIGHGGWTWYTGSSGWFYHVGIIDILGFHKIGNKLYILPAIPAKWENYKITYRYEDTTYVINVNNNKDRYEIRHDGKVVKEIVLVNDGKVHNINVNISKRGVK